MIKNWIYLTNPFTAYTDGSYSNALAISNYHLAALSSAKSDPYFNDLYVEYLTIHQSFETIYSNWKAFSQLQTGSTMSLNQLLDGLTAKVNDWEYQIMGVYKKDTEGFKSLLGMGKSAFYTGKQSERISLVKSLAKNLGSFPALANTQKDVADYAKLLDESFHNKDTAKQTTGNHSDAVEAARIILCIKQYGHLGLLMYKYAATPLVIEKYFDTASIRSNTQNTFNRTVKAGQVLQIIKRTLLPTDKVTLQNTGAAILRFYVTQNGEGLAASFVEVLPHNNITIDASQLGNVADNHTINVENTDANIEGTMTLILE